MEEGLHEDERITQSMWGCYWAQEFIREFLGILIGCGAPDERETILRMQSMVQGGLIDYQVLSQMLVELGITTTLVAEHAFLARLSYGETLSDDETKILTNMRILGDGVPPTPIEIALSLPQQDWYPHLVDIEEEKRVNLSRRAASRILRRWCDGLCHITFGNLLMVAELRSLQGSGRTGAFAISAIMRCHYALTMSAHGIDTLRGAQGWVGPPPSWMPQERNGERIPA